MRYTEREYDYNYGSFKDWIQHIAALFIVAPLRLVSEISTKLIYLNRKLIIKILNLSVIINTICLGVFCGLKMYLGTFDLWLGKIPIIIQILGLVILLLIDTWYQLYDFAIYQHVNALLPIINRVVAEDMQYFNTVSDSELSSNDKVNKHDSFEDFNEQVLNELKDLDSLNLDDLLTSDSSLDDITDMLSKQEVEIHKPSNSSETVISTEEFPESFNSFDFSNANEDLLAMINEELLNSSELNEYRHDTEIKINNMDSISTEELEQEMDDSEDPSKYIPEEHLFQFLQDLGADSFGSVDQLGGWDLATDIEFG